MARIGAWADRHFKLYVVLNFLFCLVVSSFVALLYAGPPPMSGGGSGGGAELNIGDGNFTVDSSGNVVAKTIASSSADGEHYMQAYNTTTNPACGAGTKGAIATVGSTPALQICDGGSWGALAGTGDFKADGSVPMTDGIVLADGNGDAPTTDGEMKYDRTTEKLQVGDGAATKEFVPVGVSSMITKYQYFPAAWMEDNATTPAAAAALISGEEIKARLFADNETTIVLWQVDPEWTAGLKFRVYYSLVAAGEADDTATFRLKGCSVGNSDLLTCTAGDPIGVSDEIGTDDEINELMITGWSDAVTITNLAANELARLTFYRGSDDEAGELNVIGIEIKYQAKISAASDY